MDGTNTISQDQGGIKIIEFELKLQEEECCLIDISEKSKYHKMYTNADETETERKDKGKDDNNDDEQQIVLLRTNKITVVADKKLIEIKSKESKSIHDIIFYIDVIDDFNQYEFEAADMSSFKYNHCIIYCIHQMIILFLMVYFIYVIMDRDHTLRLCILIQTLSNKKGIF